MKLRRVLIKNFRSLVDVDIPISDNCVLIGENNAGKTAMLEALQKVLTWKSQTKNFEEYDYHMVKRDDSPHKSDGITIELWFKEDESGEWAASVLQDLNFIIQTDPILDINSIGMRIHSTYDEETGENSTWDFLNLKGDPLSGRGSQKSNINKFLRHVRIFYLSSLRDARSEFSARSKFWGRIIREINISEETSEEIIKKLSELNASILTDDDRLKQVINILDDSKDIMALGGGQRTSIRALPTKPWELLFKSEVVIKSRGNELDFPISLHGHGIQSLAVIFLFQAYIDVLLKPTFNEDTVAIMALEEPEAHLHPQAIRALASNLVKINSQKIISSHSPYFIQEIPFKDIIMFRRDGAESKVLQMKQSLEIPLEKNEELDKFCLSNPKFSYNESSCMLSLEGLMNDKEYRKLIKMFSEDSKVCRQISEMRMNSKVYISDNEIIKLDTYAKRIRGEILFARGWILCEGQSDYLIIKFFADLLNKSLDHAGIAVIDFQNNGSIGAFVALAKHFDIPWVMFCDNDKAGKDYIKKINEFGYTATQMGDLTNPLPGTNTDLEIFLIKNGFKNEYQEIISDNNITMSTSEGDSGYEAELIDNIKDLKPDHASYLIEKLKKSEADESRVPPFFRDIIEDVFGLTEGKYE